MNSLFGSLGDDPFDFLLSFTTDFIENEDIIQLFLREGDICEYLSGVGQVTQSSIVWEQRCVIVIRLKMSWVLRNTYLTKLDLPDKILANVLPSFSCDILGNDVNRDSSNVIYDLLDVVLDELVKRFNLLLDETMLLEEGADHMPSFILTYVILWNGIFRL